ncbi:CRISPR-associated protein Cas4 [Oribacterium sp. NK2B42]|uniref:CRISPR-associated protein Cas4 n=1 Tax=Oribacterium sp. NK2B42 TaxID=689781 RepID=UPI0004922EB9|nr:CRISPR-associated protein Cas4 [Oribacterium sp. NK2B42]
MYKEDDYLMLSGIQHFCFCRRQWGLIHIEQQWAENLRTTEGLLMHKKAHDDSKSEKRGDLIIMRGLRVKSSKLNVTGICDVVEFRKDNGGIPLNRYEGRWQPYPVEYKNGEPKESEADVLQLCGQAMCLEEMLACTIKYGALFYGKIKHRVEVEFTDNLRKHVVDTIEEMQSYWKKGWTPRGKLTKSCYACSLNNVCLPELEKSKSVNKYIQEVLQSDEKIT